MENAITASIMLSSTAARTDRSLEERTEDPDRAEQSADVVADRLPDEHRSSASRNRLSTAQRGRTVSNAGRSRYGPVGRSR